MPVPIRFLLRHRLGEAGAKAGPKQRIALSTTAAPITLINVLTVKSSRQSELLDSLRQNTETVIMGLKGWISTNLMASADGQRVIISSQWENAASIEAMRADSRMQAYFLKVLELASLESTLGTVVLSHQR